MSVQCFELFEDGQYALSLLDDAVWRGSPHPTLECPHPPLFAVTVLMAFDQFAAVTSTKA